MSREDLIRNLLGIARQAGAIIMRHYDGVIMSREKADSSPVTAADEEAEEYILHRLQETAPGIPVVAEESTSAGRVPDIGSGSFFLVDPLDGTREFIGRNGEFTVNIALIEAGAPVAGVVFAPAQERLFWGWQRGAFELSARSGAERPIHTRIPSPASLKAVASRSHRDPETDRFLERHGVREIVSAGSSLKFCVIAAGEADIYPRFAPTMEWDTAAGHAVLLAAGGRVTLDDGVTPLSYGKALSGFRNPNFVAWAR